MSEWLNDLNKSVVLHFGQNNSRFHNAIGKDKLGEANRERKIEEFLLMLLFLHVQVMYAECDRILRSVASRNSTICSSVVCGAGKMPSWIIPSGFEGLQKG